MCVWVLAVLVHVPHGIYLVFSRVEPQGGLVPTEWDHAAEAAYAGIHFLYSPHELAACVDIHASPLVSEAFPCSCRSHRTHTQSGGLLPGCRSQ